MMAAEHTGVWLDRFTAKQAAPRWIEELRESAFQRFTKLGFPTTRDEAWRFTNVARIAAASFVPAGPAASPDVEIQAPYASSMRLVFVNGRLMERKFNPSLGLEAGLLTDHARPHLGQHGARNAFAELNTAFLDQAAFIQVARGAVVKPAIHLVYLTAPGPQSVVTHPRTLLVVGAGAQCTVVESYAGTGAYFTNAVTEIVAGEGAVVDHYKIQNEAPAGFHISTLQATLGRSANFASCSISLGAALARNDIGATLSEGADATLNGLYIASGTQHVDHHTIIDHAQPHATSHELYKGILDGKASAVFNGKVLVRKDAQKTDSRQTNQNLLLSDDARIDSKPELEIFADDVRCTHGATIGQLDAESIFYLQSRGIGREQARSLLTRAFAQDVVDRIKIQAVKDSLEAFFWRNSVSTATSAVSAPFDVEKVRADFPALHQRVHGQPLVYLDSAATAQKPLPVIQALRRFYESDCANIHRGVHELSQRATAAYEEVRGKAQRFLNAPRTEDVIFVRGATEGINLVAGTWGRRNIKEGDEVIISALEHHSNIVPWQMLCEEKGARVLSIPMDDRGDLILEEYEKLLSPRTRLVAVSHVSNALGTINPVETVIAMAHRAGALALVDGAQAAPHLKIDVQALDADFYTFSGHKVLGPTGVGILYGKSKLLDAMPPYHGGGDMIRKVTLEKTTYADPPHRFEAGTPNIAGGIGLGAALDYVAAIGIDAIAAQEHDLLVYGTEALLTVPGLRIVGTARQKAAVLSFVLDGIHPHDIGTLLDRMGIAVRTGHHCAQPVMTRFRVPATTRASLAFYNTPAELDALTAGLKKVTERFRNG